MSDEFRSVARVEELPPLGGKEVVVDGQRICLLKHHGEVFAIAAECPHKGAPMAAGWVENGAIFCALHGWKFDLRTGECVDQCATLRTFPIRVENGEILVASDSL